MDEAQMDRLVAELLDKVMDLTPDQRRRKLAELTDNNTAIDRVLALLEGEAEEDQILDTPLMTTVALDFEQLQEQQAAEKEPILRKIGHYTLEEVLGEGGMGRVFLAYQKEPVERQVALKLMRHGLASPADEARFDAERRSLARLSHPNIAQMFEAGATEDGKLFFAMELVRGMPITRYCDSKRFSITQRLQLFMDVLLAVQHAHQRQLLHRDLKPSNILVTEIDQMPTVKVIDFGISLGIDETDGEARQKGQRAGTPGYSSPESLEPGTADLGLDTRADIYTLGIVLYELVCGRRPFDEPGDSVQEVWRKINEDTPLHPAQQLTMMTGEQAEAIALARHSRLKPLIRTLSEDLDAIIMKAISRDRERRYESVTAFYDDLDALLEHKPVAAQQQDFTYLAGKFIRRHIGLAIASSLLLTALAIGLVAWSGEAKRANQEAARASREARQANQALEESRELVNFMVTLFGSTAKESGAPERMTTEEMLNLGAARIQNTETMDPLSRARLQSLLGEVYFKLFMEDEAEQMVQQALATRIDLLGEEHVLVADSKGQLGAIYANEMRIDEAEPLLLEAMATAQGATTQDLEVIASIWEALGNLYWVQVRHDEARDALERALEIRQVKMGRTDEFALAAALSSLGVLHMELEEFGRAEPYLEQAAEIRVRRLGNSIDTAKTLHNLAEAENQIGRMSDSAAHYRQAFEVYAAVEGREDGEALRALDGLMRAFTRAGRYEEGLLVGQRALEIRERRYGPDSEELIQNLVSMGINQGYTGDLDAARLQLERALSLANRYLPPTSRNTGAVQDALAWLAWQDGNYEDALERHRALLAARLDKYGPRHVLTAFSHHSVALALGSLQQFEAAEADMARAISIWERLRGPEHRSTAHSLHYQGLIVWNRGDLATAEDLLRRALAVRTRLFPPEHPDVQRSTQAVEAMRLGLGAPTVTPDH